MRKTLSILLVVAASATAYAQEFVAPSTSKRDISSREATISDHKSVDGIVNEIFVTKKPWQLVNPLAPAKYGTGEKMVSKDFGPGTPYHSTGITVAVIEW